MELLNNSNEMKTIVETFVIEETAELIYDNEQLEKWNAYVEELGLTAQKTIAKPEKSPVPFLHMKKSLVAIFETLCPRKVDIAEFGATPIPVEILELAALSKKECYFDVIQVWYDDKSPDPAVIGIKRQLFNYMNKPNGGLDKMIAPNKEVWEERKKLPNHYFSGDEITGHYLLGKWADVKHSFDELKEMATKRFISEQTNAIAVEIKTAQRKLDDLQTEAFNKFN